MYNRLPPSPVRRRPLQGLRSREGANGTGQVPVRRARRPAGVSVLAGGEGPAMEPFTGTRWYYPARNCQILQWRKRLPSDPASLPGLRWRAGWLPCKAAPAPTHCVRVHDGHGRRNDHSAVRLAGGNKSAGRNRRPATPTCRPTTPGTTTKERNLPSDLHCTPCPNRG